MKRFVSLLICFFVFGLAGSSWGAWYVKIDGSDNNTGQSWSQAFQTIQKAINSASIGDKIWVKMGTYALSSQINVNKAVGIYGGFNGTEIKRNQRDWKTNVTTVDGQNAVRCFYVTADATIDGFTITGGDAYGSSFPEYHDGGGIYNDNCSSTIINCAFLGNSASHGGGIFNLESSPVIANCTFSGNNSPEGGGIYNCFYSGPTITNCIFSNNTAEMIGGGITNESSSPIITNCTFSGNSASLRGGGIDNWAGSSPTITNCIVWGDTAPNEPEVCNDGTSSPSVSCCDIDQDGYAGIDGNIRIDPLFVDPENGYLHLQPGSPCIDAGTNSALGLPVKDFEGDPRIIDGDDDDTPTVDIGADEFAPGKLIAPNGGEVIPSGSIYTIHWTEFSEAASCKLKYSMNNGTKWKLIGSGITDTSYDWQVPTPPKNKTRCLVKVMGHDASGKKVGADRSNSTFTIEVVKVTSPNGGEILTSGDPHTITWTTHGTKKEVVRVKLLYTKNGGRTWKKIDTLTGNPGSYDWSVPDVPRTKSKCKVKVVLKDASGNKVDSDMSDSYFTIEQM